MQNDQERLINYFTQFSLGARFIFPPDEWKKGGATREPADLVWACNDCVILMYMAGAKRTKCENRNKIKRNKAINHNLKQAEGWLKEWRKGRLLEGRNGYSSYTIKYNDYKHIVVLSIIDIANGIASYHIDAEKKLSVTMCATLPQSSIEELAKSGATAIDLIILLSRLKSIKGEVKQSDLIKCLQVDREKIIKDVDPEAKWVKPNTDKTFAILQKILHLLREVGPKPINTNNTDIEFIAKVFNDLIYQDFMKLLISLAELIEVIKIDWNYIGIQKVALVYYDIIIVVTDIANSKDAATKAFDIANENSRARLVFSWIRYFPGGEAPIIASLNDEVQSFTKSFLDKWTSC